MALPTAILLFKKKASSSTLMGVNMKVSLIKINVKDKVRKGIGGDSYLRTCCCSKLYCSLFSKRQVLLHKWKSL